MGTKVYGASDDLIEFEGELRGEVSGGEERGSLVAFSDGTVLSIHYGKDGLGGVWGIRALRKGEMLDRIEPCFDAEAEVYSDVAHFKDGALRAWSGSNLEKVR